MILVNGGVTAAKGFLASGVKAGIKKSGNKDLALIYSEVPAVAAASFTTNRFAASPVKVSRLHIRHKTHQAVIVNSGNANCANGTRGDANARMMAKLAAAALGVNEKEVLVASTGIIGRPLPIGKIEANIVPAVGNLSVQGGTAFAETIMTTDTVKKEIAVKVRLGGTVVTIGGACKGVGMIYPAMQLERHATMLCFITTDAAISKAMLERALGEAIEDSFNMVSVDGDMSTNDTCFVLANGMAGNKRITTAGADYAVFAKALTYMAGELAKMLARDGEGATKFVTIEVTGAKTKSDAVAIARKISTSNLLKCAIFGHDPNWGRIAAAAGSCGVAFDPGRVDIYLGGIKVLARGGSISYDLKKVEKLFRAKEVSIRFELKSGAARATAWTCDFSKEYVAINSEYST